MVNKFPRVIALPPKAVFDYQGKNYLRQEVEVGKSDNQEIIITKGSNAGEKGYLTDPTVIKSKEQ